MINKNLFDYLKGKSENYKNNSTNHNSKSSSFNDNRAKSLASIPPNKKDKKKKDKANNNTNSNNNDNGSTRSITTKTRETDEKPVHNKYYKKTHNKILKQTKASTHKRKTDTINHLLNSLNLDIPNGYHKGPAVNNLIHMEKHNDHPHQSFPISKHILGKNPTTEHNLKAYQQWRWEHNPNNRTPHQ